MPGLNTFLPRNAWFKHVFAAKFWCGINRIVFYLSLSHISCHFKRPRLQATDTLPFFSIYITCNFKRPRLRIVSLTHITCNLNEPHFMSFQATHTLRFFLTYIMCNFKRPRLPVQNIIRFFSTYITCNFKRPILCIFFSTHITCISPFSTFYVISSDPDFVKWSIDACLPFLPKDSFWGANKTLAVFLPPNGGV